MKENSPTDVQCISFASQEKKEKSVIFFTDFILIFMAEDTAWSVLA